VAAADKCSAYAADPGIAGAVATQADIGVACDGIVAAGTPLGTHAFVDAYVLQCTATVRDEIDRLVGLPLTAQTQFAVLSRSLQRRPHHLVRTLPWPRVQGALTAHAACVADTALRVVGLDPAEPSHCTAAIRSQVRLPLRPGSLGVVDFTAVTAEAAWVAGGARADLALAEGHPELRTFTGNGVEMGASWRRVFNSAPGAFPAAACEPSVDQLGAMVDAQRIVSHAAAAVATAALPGLVVAAPEGVRHACSRLHSVAYRESVAYRDTLPLLPALTLDNPAFQGQAKLQLGIASSWPGASAVECPSCHRIVQGADIEHVLTCSRFSGARTLRHDLVLDSVRRAAASAGLSSSREPSYRRLGHSSNTAAPLGWRGDALVVMPRGLTVIDVAVVHPGASTYVDRAAAMPGAAAAATDLRKTAAYRRGGYQGFTFVPFSVESYGRLGCPAMAFLNELAEVAASSGAVSKGAFLARALRGISVALCRGNAALFRAGLSVYAHTTGTDVRSGDAVPSAD
jgi:hypothetical protein